MEEKRISNIEMLRVMSMFAIILHHYYAHGDFLIDGVFTINEIIVQLLSSGGKIAVDIFVIISGFFLVEKKFSWLKICKFLSCTYIWGLLILGFAIIYSGGIGNIDTHFIRKSLNPLTPVNGFAETYLHMYILFPLINKLIRKCTQKKLGYVIAIMVGTFFVIPTITNASMGGHLKSLLMFITFYIIGSYIRLYYSAFLSKVFQVIGLISLIVIWGTILYHDYLSKYDLFYLEKSNIMVHAFSGADIFVLLSAIGIFLWFKDHTLRYNHLINKIATTVFGIYLIHDNGFIRNLLWNKWLNVSDYSLSDFFFLHMIFVSLLVFVVCSFLEYLRIQFLEKPMMKRLSRYVQK
ncbi:acyltransferase [uncultured Veillonella sp.]|uniref:acyltransferase n=1 Tax=uncultured Veillonella sp. TaxID=159268 RepID=UPI00258DA1A3|nr:acyltransferase [uncultured Veillonella sp.]